VEEERRSARAKIHSIFYRDYKIWALDIMRKEDERENKELEDEEKRAAAARAEAAEAGERDTNISGKTQQNTKKRKPRPYRRAVEGKKRIELHAQWIDLQCKEMDEAIEFLEARHEGIMKTIKEEMRRSNKSSERANDEKLQQYNRAADKQCDRKVQSKNLVDITSWMEGSVILSYLNQKDGARPYILAEIKHRKMKYKPTKPVKEMTKKELANHKLGWNGMAIDDLKKALRSDEHLKLCKTEDPPPKYEEVKNIRPLSQKLKEWMPIQWQIFKRRKGLVEEQPSNA
jgi:hypothetical protein